MALTPAQIQEILNGINPADMDGFASNPNSVIDKMTDDEFKQGLECGNLSLEDLNYLFLYGFLSTQKSLEASKDYTDSQITERANFCNILSTDEGQLLQYRPQPDGSCGIYYGIEPPDDLLNQYVDPSTGDDSNSGTRASPLRTIKRAVERILGGTYGNIYLKEDQVHTVSSAEAWKSANINFYSYGPGCDALIADNAMLSCNWGFYGAKIAPKATIQFNHNRPTANGSVRGRCIGVGSGNFCTFFGIHFNTATNPNIYIDSGWEAGIGAEIGGSPTGQTYRFNDCSATINNGYLVAFLPGTSIEFRRTDMQKIGSGFAIKNYGNGQIECFAEPAGSACGAYLWNNGIDAATLKSTFMAGFALGAPTFKNVISGTL